MIDTHAHLDDGGFDGDRAEVMARSRQAGVVGWVVPGVSPDGWARLRQLGREFGWAVGLGVHPVALPGLLAQGRAFVLPDSLDGVVAVGECGLDGGVAVDWEVQERVLVGQLGLAREAGLPVILHGYRGHDRLVRLLKRFAPVRGVLHGFSGSADLVPVYIKLGLHLSFGGPITWERARKPVESLRVVPRERLLVESDAPDQCPQPLPTGWMGHRSEPALLGQVVSRMEALRGEALGEVLARNARELFGLPD